MDGLFFYNSFKCMYYKTTLAITTLLLLIFTSISAQAVNMLGKGILLEPQSGNVNTGVSAPYKTEYGKIIKESGFNSVRIRYQGDRNPMMIAISDGPPYDKNEDKLLDELEFIIDDLLQNDLAVVITFFGLTHDKPGDYEKMVAWWGYVAKRFKNQSHKLIFNLFVEPHNLNKNKNHKRTFEYYSGITKEIRKTNKDRIIIYFRIPPKDKSKAAYADGEKYFNTSEYNVVPKSAGIYYMWDFHVLKHNTRDNIRIIEQAWEYQNATKQAVWCSAWFAVSENGSFDWKMDAMAVNTNKQFIENGISSAYLMMFNGHTKIFDVDKDNWIYEDLVEKIVDGADIWWNLLDNPGFEQDLERWSVDGGQAKIKTFTKKKYLDVDINNREVILSQCISKAIANNGVGRYNLLAHITSKSNTSIQFLIEVHTDKGKFEFSSNKEIISSIKDKFIDTTIDISYTGKVEKAILRILINGDSCNIDKLGLTMLYYNNTKFYLSTWPNEKRFNHKYSNKSNSAIEINNIFRSKMIKSLKKGDPTIKDVAKNIHSLRVKLDLRLKQLISERYKNTTDVMQYNTSGYKKANNNKQFNKKVDRCINGKDPNATSINNKLRLEQKKALLYFIEKDENFSNLFFDVYKSFPSS